MSPNERRLLSGLALLLLPTALFFAWDFSQRAHSENRDARDALETVQLTARRATGAGIAGDIEQLRTEVGAWSWQAAQAPVAQVMAQDDLAQIAAASGLIEPLVETNDRLETAGDVTLAPMEITANFNWSGLSALMSGLEKTGKGFIIERAQLTEDREPKLRMDLKVPLMVFEADAP